MAALASATARAIANLDQQVWRGDQVATAATPGRSTGHPALDAALPGGGWPVGAMAEILMPHVGVGELGLLLPLLARVPARRWAVLIAPPGQPYAPALATAGVPLERMLFVDAKSPAHARWAARQALASHSCEAVVLWLAEADMGALRRLQLAAEESATTLILVRPESVARQPSPAVLRLVIAARNGGAELRVLKRRGPQLASSIAIDLAWPGSVAPPPHSAPSPIHALVRPFPARSGLAGLHPRAG